MDMQSLTDFSTKDAKFLLKVVSWKAFKVLMADFGDRRNRVSQLSPVFSYIESATPKIWLCQA
jgi:hypothetical protein